MRKFFASIFFATHLLATGADLVIFSYDRPLQLYALLESTQQHVCGVEQVVVLYRTSDEEYSRGYDEVAKQFPNATFIQQAHRSAKRDFKPLLMNALKKNCKSSYLFFAVDDIVIKDQVDLPLCISYLEQNQAEGFHLRMGKNLNYCYMMKARQPLPKFEELGDEVLRWQFNKGMCDWAYPHSVDCCIYRRRQILKDFSQIAFNNPNTLEAKWAAISDYTRFGLCFATSKIVNLPLNLVNETYKSNANMNSLTANDLLKLFNLGKKMDIAQLFQIDNRSAHIDYEPTFINRGS